MWRDRPTRAYATLLLKSVDQTQLDTLAQSVVLLGTSNQLVPEAAT